MASSIVLLLLSISTLLIISVAKKAPVAPGPTPAPLNLTGILEKGGQYTTFIRLLKETQVGSQIQSQLNNSFDGITIFAPTDNAFNSLKPGTLNGLTAQEQSALVLYHVVPRYYSLAMFETASNPVRTQASGNDGVYNINVTSTSSQVNVSTGVNEAQVSDSLHSDFPLAVYSVDAVLLPNDIFGVKPPASAPSPEKSSDKKLPKKTPKASGPSAEAVVSPSAASDKGTMAGLWVVAGIGLVCFESLM